MFRLTRLLSYGVLSAVLSLAACAPKVETPPAVGLELAQAPQTHAPALLALPPGVLALWVGADASGVHQDARMLVEGGLSETVVLPLPPAYPYAQRLYRAANQQVHVIWLDRDSNGLTQVLNALLTPDLRVQRGPITLTQAGALMYAGWEKGDGGLWIVSGDGLNLYAHEIDPLGRPRLSDRSPLIASAASWPAFTSAPEGGAWLFWFDQSERYLYQGVFADGQLTNRQAILPNMALQPSDAMLNFQAGRAADGVYLLWQILRGSEQPEAWIARQTSDGWRPPSRLTLPDGAPVAWAALAAGDVELHLALQAGDQLGIGQLQGGVIRHWQPLVTTALVGVPTLIYRNPDELVLAWSQPASAAQASLRILTFPV